MKEFSKYELAAIKRTAQTVKPLLAKVAKINEKIAALEQEKSDVENSIRIWETPIKEMSGGYTSTEILNKSEDISEENITEVEFEETKVIDSPNLHVGNKEYNYQTKPFEA